MTIVYSNYQEIYKQKIPNIYNLQSTILTHNKTILYTDIPAETTKVNKYKIPS